MALRIMGALRDRRGKFGPYAQPAVNATSLRQARAGARTLHVPPATNTQGQPQADLEACRGHEAGNGRECGQVGPVLGLWLPLRLGFLQTLCPANSGGVLFAVQPNPSV